MIPISAANQAAYGFFMGAGGIPPPLLLASDQSISVTIPNQLAAQVQALPDQSGMSRTTRVRSFQPPAAKL
jgi:hypothetical protein